MGIFDVEIGGRVVRGSNQEIVESDLLQWPQLYCLRHQKQSRDSRKDINRVSKSGFLTTKQSRDSRKIPEEYGICTGYGAPRHLDGVATQRPQHLHRLRRAEAIKR